MARDFWGNAFVRRQLPPLADFTDVLEKHPKSTLFVEEYWRRRDDPPGRRRNELFPRPPHQRRLEAVQLLLQAGKKRTHFTQRLPLI